MVYLHSYFNRKSEASVGLLEDKKRIKSKGMNSIMEHMNQILPKLTEDQFHRLLELIDCIQKNCNQGMIDNYSLKSNFCVLF